MSAIAHFLESEGIQTTGISLVRENTESLRPPRFLWTSFPLGRPLGMPNDQAFQRRVILAALALLDRPQGPVLEDYPEDLPDIPLENAPACPVSFARTLAPDQSWLRRLSDELSLLQPWYELSRARRGRTTVGIANAPAHTLEDLKSFWQEALTAQPGERHFRETERMLWQETQLGEAMLALHARYRQHQDRRLQAFARGIAPRSQLRD